MTPQDLTHVDIQGIPWQLATQTREAFREVRRSEYADFERRRHVRVWNADRYRGKEGSLYGFRMMNRMDNCSINHFQLRHLISVTSCRGVYFPRMIILG